MRRVGNTEAAALVLALGLLAGAQGLALAAGADTPGVRVEASVTSDDNVNRAASAESLSDSIFGLRVTANAVVPVSTRTRAVIAGFAGTEQFNKNTGLSRNVIGAQGDFRFRSSGEFSAATYAAFLRTAAEYYRSDLRDGYRHAFGVNVVKPVTDRLQLFGAITENITDGNSTVFDTKNLSLRGNLDWSFTRSDVLYLGLEYRQGDIVSTSSPSLGIIATADAIVQDDAFTDAVLFAYRFKARTWITTVGYNHAFGAGHSLDVSWRRADASALDPASGYSASDFRYVVNQLSLAYLARF